MISAPLNPEISSSAISRSGEIWLCIDFPLLGLESYPEYRSEQPSVLMGQHRVLALNAEAEDHGLEAGMSLPSCQSLCSEVASYTLHLLQLQQTLDKLAFWAWRYTPVVVRSGTQQHLLLEIGSCLKLHKGLARLLGDIEQTLSNRFTCILALGHTPKAAQLLVRQRSSWQSVTAGDMSLNHEALNQQLEQAPLYHLPLNLRQEQALTASGLETLGQLKAIESAAIKRRFGAELPRYLEQLWGRRADPQPDYQPPPHFAERRFFLEPLENRQHLFPIMETLLDELHHYLRWRQLYTQQFEFVLHQREESQRFTVSLATAHNRLAAFVELTELAFAEVTLNDAVHTLELRCTQLVSAEPAAQALFADENTAKPIEELQDRLRARLGQEAVYQINERPSHLPEHSIERCRVHSPRERQADISNVSERQKLRPLWLLEQPQALSGLYYEGPLVLQSSAERISGYWWQQAQARDYFIASNPKGSLLWVFQNKQDQRWFLHGLFA